MRPRPIVRFQALVLVALIGGLSSGLPSHHHERPDRGPVLADAGHHAHGMQLVDPTERLTSHAIVAALPAGATIDVGEGAPTATMAVERASPPAARGRAPPSDRPRAPPVSV